MNIKEYTYDIDKYTIGVDTNGEDGIGLTVAKVENGDIYFLGNCYGENARCIDLLIKENQELKTEKEQLNSLVNSCQEEIRRLKKQLHKASIKMQEMIEQDIECPSNCSKLKELKKQLEEKQNPFKGIFAQVNDDTLLRDCGNMNAEINELKNQQKEFIDYMNKTIEELECDDVDDEEMKGYLIQRIDTFKEILRKYKSIIGDDK